MGPWPTASETSSRRFVAPDWLSNSSGATNLRLDVDRKSTRLNSSHQSTRRLHSFPTRRSSDLDGSVADRFGDIEPEIRGTRLVEQLVGCHESPARCRSEEHTSELQSPIDTSIALFPYTTLFRSRWVRGRPLRRHRAGDSWHPTG